LQLIQQDRPLANSDVRVFKKLQEKIPDLLPNENKPVLIHGDLWSGNYMHTNNGPALIDPAAYFASREMEFAIITMFGGFSSHFFGAYNEINALPNDWKERNKLYQLYHILNHYYLFGGGYAEDALHIARFYI
jgi:fructosamine-3-kinase